MTATHPLDMLTGDEIIRAAEILRASGRVPESALFAHMVLHEPEKEALARWQPDDPVERRVRVVVVPGPTMRLHEVVVSVTKGEIVDWRDHDDMRPALLMTEAVGAITTTKQHPEYVAALAKRGSPISTPCRSTRGRRGVRLRVRGGPPDHALHLVPAHRRDRQRLRARSKD